MPEIEEFENKTLFNITFYQKLEITSPEGKRE